jgi:HAD superfamily hydrolase (TIGR01509 family)
VPAYDAILFDFDGVLADTEPLHYNCWRQIIAPFGIDLDWETYSSAFIGIPDSLMLAEFSKKASPPVELQILLDQYPRKRDMFREMILRDLPFFPGCRAFLDSLGAVKLAVVTSSGRSEIEPALHRAGILDCFATAVYGGDVRDQKPAPEPYLLAASRLKVRCPLVVEDSEAGVQSARAAAFDVIQVKSPAEVAAAVQMRLSA